MDDRDIDDDVDDEDAVHRTKNQRRLPQVRSDEVIVSSFAIFYCNVAHIFWYILSPIDARLHRHAASSTRGFIDVQLHRRAV